MKPVINLDSKKCTKQEVLNTFEAVKQFLQENKEYDLKLNLVRREELDE